MDLREKVWGNFYLFLNEWYKYHYETFVSLIQMSLMCAKNVPLQYRGLNDTKHYVFLILCYRTCLCGKHYEVYWFLTNLWLKRFSVKIQQFKENIKFTPIKFMHTKKCIFLFNCFPRLKYVSCRCWNTS